MPSLRTMLLDMANKDQEIRHKINFDYNPQDNLVQSMLSMDRKHTEIIKKINKKHGWPKASMVGYDGVYAFWLLIQHTSDKQFQRNLLPHIETAFKEDELDAQYYALFVDRLLVSEGKPQKFETQIKSYNNDAPVLFPIENPGKVDTVRANMGLIKLQEYLSIANNAKKTNCKTFFMEEYET
jgi:hypothetical protein